MAFEIKRAERKRQHLKLGLVGPSGSGKTYSALRLAFGMGEKVALIDTEAGSGDLYADIHKDGIGEYASGQIVEPYTAAKYKEAIDAVIGAGFEVVIVDSLTHLWAGAGGLLEKKDSIASRTGNSYTAWGEPTKDYNTLIAKILTAPIHMICTFRSKQDYVQEKNLQTGKTEVKKVGMGAIFRDGAEYEFTTVWELDSQNHAMVGAVGKDRTGLFKGRIEVLTPDHGKEIMAWLASAKPGLEPEKAELLGKWYKACGEPLPDLAVYDLAHYADELRRLQAKHKQAKEAVEA